MRINRQFATKLRIDSHLRGAGSRKKVYPFVSKLKLDTQVKLKFYIKDHKISTKTILYGQTLKLSGKNIKSILEQFFST